MFGRIISTMLIFLGLSGGGYYLAKEIATSTPPEITDTQNKDRSSTPTSAKNIVIDVKSAPVFLLTVGQGKELKTGDTLKVGDSVSTSNNSYADIYLPDQSIIRLDKSTTLNIESFNFDQSTGKLSATFKLTSGRVWSKIATENHNNTSFIISTDNTNVEATGTVFLVGSKNKVTSIASFEHQLNIRLKDKDTEFSNSTINLLEKKYLTISDKDISILSATTSTSTINSRIVDLPNSIKNDTWVKNNLLSDKDTGKIIKSVNTAKDTSNTSKAEDKQSDSKTPASSTDTKTSNNKAPEQSTKNATSASGGVAQSSSSSNLVIKSSSTYSKMNEGDTAKFQALYKGADVTGKVSWSVVGSIGSIDNNGNFSAKLGDDVSEAGEAYGSVKAIYSGGSDVAESSPIKVYVNIIPVSPQDIGGQ